MTLEALSARGTFRVPEAILVHRQSWGRRGALLVHVQSGRAYGASARGWSIRDRLNWLLALPGMPWRLYALTAASLRCGAGGATPVPSDTLWLALLIVANLAGQVTGALAGAGASYRKLV